MRRQTTIHISDDSNGTIKEMLSDVCQEIMRLSDGFDYPNARLESFRVIYSSEQYRPDSFTIELSYVERKDNNE